MSTAGAPSVDVQSFGARYDAEDLSGPLHSIVNNDRDSFSNTGIKIMPDNTPQDMGMGVQPDVNPEHPHLEKAALHALKSKK